MLELDKEIIVGKQKTNFTDADKKEYLKELMKLNNKQLHQIGTFSKLKPKHNIKIIEV